MGMHRIGNWELCRQVIENLKSDCVDANEQSLKLFALKGEKIAKEHMANQDLGWAPLKDAYEKSKVRKGYSKKILIKTSSYFQSITSWSTKARSYIGVKRNVKNKDGEEVANIAKVHEYGSASRNIQARPLWKPSYKETIAWWRKNATPALLYMKLAKKKYNIK